jgi:2-oxoglutarate ferredoxin oxidoreductase subunit alpha
MAKELIKGNIAIAQAAFDAGCDCYFAYPITPQTEIGEYLSSIMPKNKRAYVCAESEIASINMCIGAAATGAKPMTSSASCAISLMQEGLSYACGEELPIVLISVMRAGPGLGNIYPSQADYDQAVTGGGNGDYKLIVLAPANIQECIDLTHKAFYLAQKYRNPVMVLADGLLGQMMEPAEFTSYTYPHTDNSEWILSGAKSRTPRIVRSLSETETMHIEKVQKLFNKYAEIEEKEVLYDELYTEDAEIIVVSFGSLSRNVKAAVKAARKEGIKAGYFRPITLNPFPNEKLKQLSEKTKKFIVAEMNMGQMIRDVKSVVGDAIVVHKGRPAGNWLDSEEIIYSIKDMMGE